MVILETGFENLIFDTKHGKISPSQSHRRVGIGRNILKQGQPMFGFPLNL